jgi:phosphoribosyl-ATP pyrophosphohydrolase/phosphoribosyl-AMP cyclohydrolase
VNPVGPVCHKGDDTCFEDSNISDDFIIILENIIEDRKNIPSNSSYVSSLFKKGTNKIAQKVGEEAVELVIEAKDDNDDLFLNESADLFFHYLILLQQKNYKIKDVLNVLKSREK